VRHSEEGHVTIRSSRSERRREGGRGRWREAGDAEGEWGWGEGERRGRRELEGIEEEDEVTSLQKEIIRWREEEVGKATTETLRWVDPATTAIAIFIRPPTLQRSSTLLLLSPSGDVLSIHSDGDRSDFALIADQTFDKAKVRKANAVNGTADSLQLGTKGGTEVWRRQWRRVQMVLWEMQEVLPKREQVGGEERVQQDGVEEVLSQHPPRGEQIPVIPGRDGEWLWLHRRLWSVREKIRDIWDVVEVGHEKGNLSNRRWW
jgi:hypothetical protein